MFEDLGIVQCEDDCQEEKEVLDKMGLSGLTDEEALISSPKSTIPAMAVAATSATRSLATVSAGKIATPASVSTLDGSSLVPSVTTHSHEGPTGLSGRQARDRRHLQMHKGHKGGIKRHDHKQH